MASIGRWLYRLFSICLPCLKSAETNEKESEDYPRDLNSFKNDTEDNQLLEKKYPDDLNPFASEEGEGNENLNEKAEKEGHEDEYQANRNPFASDDEEKEREIDYPEELNPFANEEDGETDTIVNQSSPAHELAPPLKNVSFSSVSLANEEKSDDAEKESEQQGNEYPENLNPFASEDEEDDYPDELNPFADEKDDEADSALVNQSAATLSNELTAPPSNGSSSKFPLPYEEKSVDEKKESDQQGEEYPDSLNPFASEDEAHDYPEALNPFAREDKAQSPQSSSETSCPEPSIYKNNEYDEALNPFASEDVENNESILKNLSITIDPQQTTAAVNGSSSLVPLANERKKRKPTKKYRAPNPPMTMRIIPSDSAPGVNESSSGVNESDPGFNETSPGVNESALGDSEISGPVPLTVKVDDYDEALNPFASEDEEVTGGTTGILPSSPAQPIAYSCTSVNVKRKKVKSLKKRRAPDPPVIESTKEGSAARDIIANQPCASSCPTGTRKSNA